MSPVAYIGFGSNQGDRQAKYEEAVNALNQIRSIIVLKCSRLYETDPVGLVDGGAEFLNGAVAVETDLDPTELMAAMRSIELQLGKSPDHRSDMSRPVDLDLLLYGDETVRQGGITIPHPRMHVRAFVLAPLAEIASEAMHPTLNRSVRSLLEGLSEEEKVDVRLWRERPS